GIKVKGLGVELLRKRLDLLLVDRVPTARKSSSDVQVVEEEGPFPADRIRVRHDQSLPSCRVSRWSLAALRGPSARRRGRQVLRLPVERGGHPADPLVCEPP